MSGIAVADDERVMDRMKIGRGPFGIALRLVAGFVVGFSACYLLFGRVTAKDHWKAVARYNAYMADRANYKRDPATGLLVTTPPLDPVPDLEALVAAGELIHADLVFPTVPNGREVGRHWMKFCNAHNEIVYWTGASWSAPPVPKGTQPLHLNLWYSNGAEPVVEALIREVEGSPPK